MLVMTGVSAVIAADVGKEDINPEFAALASKVPPAQASDISLVAEGGLYQIRFDANTFVYVTKDAKYMITGDLFSLDAKQNLSEVMRETFRREQLHDVSEAGAIVYEPIGKTKYTITVFTDPDCPYCRRFHSEISHATDAGIRVKYLAFPRSGPDTDSWRKAESIWCSKDVKEALTAAMLGNAVQAHQCQSPIMRHFELGTLVGVRGTPMIVSDSGALIGGYMPTSELVKKLEEIDKLRTGQVAGVVQIEK